MTDTNQNHFLWIVAIVAVVAIVAIVMTTARGHTSSAESSFTVSGVDNTENSGGEAYALGWDNTRSCGGNCWIQTRTREFSSGTVTCTRQCTYDANNVETCGASSCSW